MSLFIKTIREVKNKNDFSIPLSKEEQLAIVLRPVQKKDIADKKIVRALASWRKKYARWFPSQFKVTLSGTRHWLENLVVNQADRVLFLIEDGRGKIYGHLGFWRYNGRDKSCELDNVVRGVNDFPGLMTKSVKTLIRWGFENLGIKKLYLTVFADNEKAIALYRRCNFVEFKKIPLKKVVRDKSIYWEEINNNEKAQKYNLKMIYAKES